MTAESEHKVISFEEAIGLTENVERSVLIGNGFSYAYFNYTNLLKNAGLETNESLLNLFEALKTVDFEYVIRTLEDAALVEEKYHKASRAHVLRKEAQKLRRALVHAIRAVHPNFYTEVAGIEFAFEFIEHFSNLFTLNYDFLLHWVRLRDTDTFTDGFGLGNDDGEFRGPFSEEAWCNVYNVHGGLHLFSDADGAVRKRIGEPAIVEAIGKTIVEGKRLPLYVAEGTSSQKLAKIFGSPYLRYCYEQIRLCKGAFFVFGHSADRNDEHIYLQIFRSGVGHLYFCVHNPTPAKLAQLNADLVRYRALSESNADFTFVDSASANAWGA
ncbi:DUF4917 family protein [Bradyrhizobium sp. LMG 9283]|uniref:DUF4917 family protein n=1 Tax=Bradyrhizobium sp. LMG 9283 TaxID=592064 RepID=UPI0038905CFB